MVYPLTVKRFQQHDRHTLVISLSVEFMTKAEIWQHVDQAAAKQHGPTEGSAQSQNWSLGIYFFFFLKFPECF